MNIKIKDFPKIESPFVRVMKNGNYVVKDLVATGYNWVFEDKDVEAIEKLDGTNVSVVIKEGQVISVWNRTERIPFINKPKAHIIEGLLEAKKRGYLELPDGQHFGELIGEKINSNPYKLKGHLWIPFSTFAKNHLRYKSWGKYPKDFKTISEWFKNDLIPLYASMQGNREDGYVEGVVFYNKDGRMAKLRKDMFDWFTNKEHKR